MRVLVAPDKYAGTLTAVEAAEAIAEGWRRHAPDDEMDLAPMSDGGPGFVDVVAAATGGELLATAVTSLPDQDVQYDALPATLLRVEDTVYLECAQAVGLDVAGDSEPLRRSSHAVGVLLAHALEAGARRIVVGVGGTSTTDGGAGLLAALGAYADGGDLDDGPEGLRSLRGVDLGAAPELFADVELVLASDVTSPLAGLHGAAKIYGPQKGIADGDLPWVDGALQRFAELTDRRLALEPGAGAGGGIGFGLMLLGARRVSGMDLVADLTGLRARAERADVVLTGEGSFDFSSRAGKVPAGVAAVAAEALRPCVVLAGRVDVGAREMRALGMDAAYSLVESAGAERAMAQPAEVLAEVAERVARTWSH
ncbi:MAG: glycerate kinase [Nocardioidaceae bacterium]|nr:glycerate kinase [Nocardioidaceae bacterium]MCL2614346.1 glycerate kinase [Nocardioidaceae bacterium]